MRQPDHDSRSAKGQQPAGSDTPPHPGAPEQHNPWTKNRSLPPPVGALGKAMIVVLAVVSPLVHLISTMSSVAVLDKVWECPYDSVGGLATDWVFVGVMTGLYLVVLATALVSTTWMVCRRDGGALRADISRGFRGPNFGLRLGPSLLLHPVLVVFAVSVFLLGMSGSCGTAVWGLCGNPCQYVHSDLGAERRAHNQHWISARHVSDKGLAAIAEPGASKFVLRVSESPEITVAGLSAFSHMPELDWVEFHAHGVQREWGDAEVALITQGRQLRTVDLCDFGRLSDQWLLEFPKRGTKLRGVSISGVTSITPEGEAAFRAAFPDHRLSVKRPEAKSPDESR